jgi:hypothetical protein
MSQLLSKWQRRTRNHLIGQIDAAIDIHESICFAIRNRVKKVQLFNPFRTNGAEAVLIFGIPLGESLSAIL